MKKFVFASLAFMLALPSMAKDYKYESVKNDPMQTRIYTLDNGLRVYMSVNKVKPRVTAHIAVNTGSRNDPSDCTGLAHYLEHIMFKGSTNFGTSDYAKEKPYLDQIRALYEEYRKLTDPEARRAKYHEIDSISQIAAQYNIPNEYDKLMAIIGSNGSNAYTSYDITCYTEDVPSNELERWAHIQSDRMRNLVIRGFHTELEAVYEEKNMSLTDDNSKQTDALLAKLFPTHAYGTQTVIGTQDHLQNPSIVEIEKYYGRYYVPNNVAICLAGDFDPDRTIAMIDREFGMWKPGADITPRQYAPQMSVAAPIDTTVVGQQMASVMLGWRFDGAASMQMDTLSLVNSILSNGKCGLVDLDIVQQQKALAAETGIYDLKDYSAYILYAVPTEGQTLKDARQLLLAEIEKLRNGDFDESLVKATVNNLKLSELRQLDENRSRMSKMVNAFINGVDWADEVGQLDRMSRITKADIVSFARKHLNDNYVTVFKETGVDSTVKKVVKPAITPIPTNRDKQSQFLAAIASEEVAPIAPQFVDFSKELTFTSTKKKLPVIYKQNTENQLFNLVYRWEFGTQADNRYAAAANYADLLGTSTMSVEELNKKFYELACNYSISVSDDAITVSLSGLQENMAEATRLLEQAYTNLKADDAKYADYVKNTLDARALAKKEQRACFAYLREYAINGPRNSSTNVMSADELRATKPSVLTDLLKGLNSMEHTVAYYGPASVDELCRIVTANHATVKKPVAVPQNKPYEWKATPKAEVIIAPYDAKNIYMNLLTLENKPLDINRIPTISLFNEYFGGGMNTIVFQELREARGLAYSASARYYTPSKKGIPEYCLMNIITQNDKMMDCIGAFREITDNMPETPAAFETAKQNIVKSIAASRVTKFGVISRYFAAKRLGIDYDINRKIFEEVPQLKLSDISAFMKQNVANRPLRYIILGNESELDMESLQKIAPVRRVSLEDIFGF